MARRPTAKDRDAAELLASLLAEIIPPVGSRAASDWRSNFLGDKVLQRDIPERVVKAAHLALRAHKEARG